MKTLERRSKSFENNCCIFVQIIDRKFNDRTIERVVCLYLFCRGHRTDHFADPNIPNNPSASYNSQCVKLQMLTISIHIIQNVCLKKC